MKSGDRLYIGIRRVPIWRISMEMWFHHWSGSSIKSGLAWIFLENTPHLEIIMKSLLHSGPLCLEIGITRRSWVQENQDSFQHLEIKRPLRGLRKPKVTQLLIPPNCQGRAVRSHKYSYEKTCRDRDKRLMLFPKIKITYFSMTFGAYAGI